MKPLIRKRHGIWYCGYASGRFIFPPYGHGHTPREAWEEWRKQQ